MDDRTIMRERRDFTLIFDNIKNFLFIFDWSLKLGPENIFTGIEWSGFPIFQKMDKIWTIEPQHNERVEGLYTQI